MLPYIIIGDLKIPIFSFGLSIVFLVFLFLCVKSAEEKGLGENTGIEISLLISFSTIIFSKVALGLIYGWKISSILKFWETGHSLFSALIIGTTIIFIYSKIKKLDFYELLSALTYPTFFSLSLYRIFVCLPTGCCYGFPSRFGITFSPESYASRDLGVSVAKLFPSQIIEAILFFICGMIMYFKRKDKAENNIQLFLLLLTLERIIAEFIRRDIKEKIIKAGDYGISVWLILSVLLFSATSIYFNLLKPYIKSFGEKMKENRTKIFKISAVALLLFSQLVRCSDKKSNIDLSAVENTLRSAFSLSYTSLFISYIFLKIKGFLGSCIYREGENKIVIDCEFDIRILSAEKIKTKGTCNFSSFQNSITFSNCEIQMSGTNFYGEITGNTTLKGESDVYIDNATVYVIKSLYSNFTAEIIETKSSLVSIQGESTRIFKIGGKMRTEKTEISAENIFLLDEGTARIGIMINGSVSVKVCGNFKLDVKTENFVYFDEQGCPYGSAEINGEKIYFSAKELYTENKNTSSPCRGEKSECPFLYF